MLSWRPTCSPPTARSSWEKGLSTSEDGLEGNQGGTAADRRQAGGINIGLHNKLCTTMDAIMASVHPAFCMFFFAAFLDDNVRVYHFATAWAIPDHGVVAPVVQIRTPFPSHACFFLSWRIDVPADMTVLQDPGEFGKSQELPNFITTGTL